jgi:hypothetical protein
MGPSYRDAERGLSGSDIGRLSGWERAHYSRHSRALGLGLASVYSQCRRMRSLQPLWPSQLLLSSLALGSWLRTAGHGGNFERHGRSATEGIVAS